MNMRNSNLEIIIEHLSKMQAELYRRNGRKVVTRISIDSEVAAGAGLAPGCCALLHTSSGSIELYAERRLDVEWQRQFLGEWTPHT